MDFKDTLGSYEFMLPLEIIEVGTSNHQEESYTADSRSEMAQKNEHLIDKCLSTKRFDIIDKMELKNYGMLALYSAAMDFIYGLDFEEFALKRIERHMNVAIAEKMFYTNASDQELDKKTLNNEFQSIYKRFP